MKILPNVVLNKLQTPMVNALPVINAAFSKQGIDCTITCGNEGKHMKGSLHPAGLALDFRTRELPSYAVKKIVKEIDAELGDYYDVVLESTHLHVEYDRKGKSK